MKKETIILLILKYCQGSSKSEFTEFGSYVDNQHPVISHIREQTGIQLQPKDIRNKTVGKIADNILLRMK